MHADKCCLTCELSLLRRQKHSQFSFHTALNPQAEEHTWGAEGVALDSISFYSWPKYTQISVQVKNYICKHNSTDSN